MAPGVWVLKSDRKPTNLSPAPQQTTTGGPAGTRPLNGYLNCLAVKPDNPDVVFMGRYGLLRSEDCGDTWQKVDLPILTSASAFVSSIDFCLSKPETAYCLAEDRLFASNDGGIKWEQVSDGHHCVVRGTPSRVSVDPFDASRVLVFERERMLASTDGGVTFDVKMWHEIKKESSDCGLVSNRPRNVVSLGPSP